MSTDDVNEWNCDCDAVSSYQTLAQLRQRMLIQLGYANQSANPPPGMIPFCNEYLLAAQNYLYLTYREMRTTRFYKWGMVEGQRYYGLMDSQSTECPKTLNQYKVEWVGFEDLNHAWYPLIQGIDPVLYTRAQTSPGFPTFYEIRSCIEIWPAPQAAYTLWVKGDFGLESFTADDDQATIDSELVLLMALGNAKTAKGQKDAQSVLNLAADYRRRLVAGRHNTARYTPRKGIQPPWTPPKLLPLP